MWCISGSQWVQPREGLTNQHVLPGPNFQPTFHEQRVQRLENSSRTARVNSSDEHGTIGDVYPVVGVTGFMEVSLSHSVVNPRGLAFDHQILPQQGYSAAYSTSGSPRFPPAEGLSGAERIELEQLRRPTNPNFGIMNQASVQMPLETANQQNTQTAFQNHTGIGSAGYQWPNERIMQQPAGMDYSMDFFEGVPMNNFILENEDAEISKWLQRLEGLETEFRSPPYSDAPLLSIQECRYDGSEKAPYLAVGLGMTQPPLLWAPNVNFPSLNPASGYVYENNSATISSDRRAIWPYSSNCEEVRDQSGSCNEVVTSVDRVEFENLRNLVPSRSLFRSVGALSADDWNRVRETFVNLYNVLELEEVARIMQEDHCFSARYVTLFSGLLPRK